MLTTNKAYFHEITYNYSKYQVKKCLEVLVSSVNMKYSRIFAFKSWEVFNLTKIDVESVEFECE